MNVDSIGQSGSMMPMQGMPPKPPSAADIGQKTIEEKDTDGDGVLSSSELGISEENFSLLDTDGDGVVSQEELVARISEKLQLLEQDGERPDINALKSALAEIGVDMPEGPPPPSEGQTGDGMISQALDQFNLTDEEKTSLLDILRNQSFDAQA
jgi:hypothetical protein